jgi:adenylate cyclase class 2
MEIEAKVKVKIKEMEKRIRGLGARFVKEERQEDIYFAHPSRDFRVWDEALRVRRVEGECILTYKGARQNSKIKTRPEIEAKVEEAILDILRVLGFSEVRRVVKQRDAYQWDKLKVYLDKVEGLGEFLEVEGQDSEDTLKILGLLGSLNIAPEELIGESYLEMLEDKVEIPAKDRRNFLKRGSE